MSLLLSILWVFFFSFLSCSLCTSFLLCLPLPVFLSLSSCPPTPLPVSWFIWIIYKNNQLYSISFWKTSSERGHPMSDTCHWAIPKKPSPDGPRMLGAHSSYLPFIIFLLHIESQELPFQNWGKWSISSGTLSYSFPSPFSCWPILVQLLPSH